MAMKAARKNSAEALSVHGDYDDQGPAAAPVHSVPIPKAPSRERDENGNVKRTKAPAWPRFLGCTVSSFLGIVGLGAGCMVIMGLDVVAFILLLTSGILWSVYGIVTAVFFLLSGNKIFTKITKKIPKNLFYHKFCGF